MIHWLVRAKRWAQHPPSWRRVKLVFAVIGIAAVIFGLEWLGLWPEALTTERVRGPGAIRVTPVD